MEAAPLRLKSPVEINLQRLLKAVERQLSSAQVDSEENQTKLQFSLRTCQEFLQQLRTSHRPKATTTTSAATATAAAPSTAAAAATPTISGTEARAGSWALPNDEQLHEYHRKITTLLSLCQPKSLPAVAVDASVGVAKRAERSVAEELYVKKTERNLREELFGKSYEQAGDAWLVDKVSAGTGQVTAEQISEIQDQVAEDMAAMAEQLKHSSLRMRDLVTSDSKTLEEIGSLQTHNQTKLVAETSLLKRTISSTLSFTVLVWLLLLAVFGSFVFMYLTIRWFPRRSV